MPDSCSPLPPTARASGDLQEQSNSAQDAWGRLYRTAFPQIYRALLAITLNPDDALDAVHDAFLEGLRRPPAHQENLTGWLFRVAVRTARRGQRRHVRLLNRLQRNRVSKVLRLEEAIVDRLEASRLLRMLTLRQREVVVAKYILGLSQKEIAVNLDLERGTVGATLSQAIKKMRGRNGDE